MCTWIEEELNMLYLYNEQSRCSDLTLPLHPEDHFYALDSDFRAQELKSMGSASSGNYFSSRVQATMYGRALSVMMRLRHSPGNVPFTEGTVIIQVETNPDSAYDVWAQQIEEPQFAISGFFLTLEQAEAAIETIGSKHIALAHKTLMCIR